MALNEEEAGKEMKKMVAFIMQEADEKCREIKVKADEEFNVEKAKLVHQETVAIEAQFERKLKQAEIKRKIAQSNQVNKARLRALQARDELLENIREEAKVGLSKVSSSPQYPSFLEALILQSFCRLIDGKNFTPIIIQVRQADVEMAKKALVKALEAYKKLTNGVQLDKVTIDEQHWLDANCAGGIVANTLNGRIKFNNTIEARLELATEALLPALRTNLFGASECRKFFD